MNMNNEERMLEGLTNAMAHAGETDARNTVRCDWYRSQAASIAFAVIYNCDFDGPHRKVYGTALRNAYEVAFAEEKVAMDYAGITVV